MEAPLVPEGVVLERAMALLKEFETGEFAGESLELTNEILAGLREEYGNATVGAYEEVIAKAVGQNMSSVGQKRKTTEEEAPAAAEGSEKKPKVEAKAAIDAKAPVKAEVVKAEAGAEPNANVQLSKTRFLKVSNWSGKTFADFREWYEKDGEMKPGKKGISLSLDQWEIFKAHVGEIDEAFQSSNTKFALVLSNPNSSKPKRVNINEYKGKFFVNIREWYEKDGELKPGFKGLTINKEQWQVVLDQLNAFHAALTAAQAPK